MCGLIESLKDSVVPSSESTPAMLNVNRGLHSKRGCEGRPGRRQEQEQEQEQEQQQQQQQQQPKTLRVKGGKPFAIKIIPPQQMNKPQIAIESTLLPG